MLIAGLSVAVALAGAVTVLALGGASGGFGLVARIALPGSRPRRRSGPGGSAVPPLRVPQTR